MGKMALNKSSLQKQREQLKLYQRVLPSLDLKRRQLSAELSRAQAILREQQREEARLVTSTGEKLPMLAGSRIDLEALVSLTAVEMDEENLLGTRLPRLVQVHAEVRKYSLLAKPFWVDTLVESIRQTAEIRLKLAVQQERVRRLAKAVRRITQRVNLFEKVLIPQTRENIRRIRIFLGDLERAQVVRSKIAKAKRLGKVAAEQAQEAIA
jgi:V/A-type H+-transporting ATPase subunit D